MENYAWVEHLEAYCFTAIRGLCPEEAIRRLGGDPARVDRRTFDECFWTVDDPQWALVGTLDGAVLVAEHNGWRAEEAAETLSAGATLACFFRNVTAVMRFVYAVDGAILAEFDPLLDRRPVAGTDPDVLRPVLDGLQFGLFGAECSSMALLERLTGVRITPDWLGDPQPAVPLPALP